MIIHIFKNCKVTRCIKVDEEAALPLFNLILQALNRMKKLFFTPTKAKNELLQARVAERGVNDQ